MPDGYVGVSFGPFNVDLPFLRRNYKVVILGCLYGVKDKVGKQRDLMGWL